MIKRFLLVTLFLAGLFAFKSLDSKVAMASDFIRGNLDNSAGTIPITVTVHFYNKNGEPSWSPAVYTLAVGELRQIVSAPVGTGGNNQPYSISWGTSCTDPVAIANISQSILFADFYDFATQDVHCKTPNAEPQITYTNCASFGWDLVGVGSGGANIAKFAVFRGPPGVTNPDNYLIDGNVSASARSYDFGALGAGTYYVRVSAISPQGQWSAPSYGSFTCGAPITPAGNLNASATCPYAGAGNIVNVSFSWMLATSSDEQWLDYSVWPNNFVPGTYTGVNVGPGARSYNGSGFAQAVRYYWRVNNRYGSNWYPSNTGIFDTPTCASAGPSPVPSSTSTIPPGGGTNDIAMTYLQLYQTVVAPGATVTGSGTIKNVGTNQICSAYSPCGSGTSWTFSTYANMTNVPACGTVGDQTGYANWAFGIFPLAPGASWQVSISFTAPSTPGTYTALAYADSNCVIPGDPVANNWLTVPYTVVVPTPGGLASNEQACYTTPTYGPGLTLSWLAVTGATNYEVWLSTDGVNYVTKTAKTTTATSVSGTGGWSTGQPYVTAGGDLNLSVGTTYYWKVRVQIGGVLSNWSANDQVGPVPLCAPPANPSNLQATVSCSGNNPIITFSFTDNANNETGFWLDVNGAAWTGPSGPLPWGNKTLPAGAGTGTVQQFAWSATSAMDTGDVNPVTAGYQRTPENGKTYWWRVKAFNTGSESAHVYPLNTTTPPGLEVTPNCAVDLDFNDAAAELQFYSDNTYTTPKSTFMTNETIYVQVKVTNHSSFAVSSPFKTAFYLDLGASPGCNQVPTTSKTVAAGFGAGAVDTWQFSIAAPATVGIKNAYAYADYECVIVETRKDNNIKQKTYNVSINSWFQTTGGDVGARGSISVSLDPPPGDQSQYIVVANNTGNARGKWKLNSYNKPLFPPAGQSTKVYDFLADRFKQKAQSTGTATCSFSATMNGYYYCSGDVAFNGVVVPTSGNSVFFIDGNLDINQNFNIGSATIIFVVGKSITISTTTTQADGIYIARNTFIDTSSAGIVGGQLAVNGAVYAGSLSLSRLLGSGLDATTPADVINYQPKYVMTMPSLLGSPTVSWKEVAP